VKQQPKSARARFAEVVSREEDFIDLAEAALLIAAEEYPGLDVALYLNKLDEMGDLARERVASSETALGFISVINAVLFDDIGFRGNTESYYDPRNSYLNEVIDRRTGIPITLTLVYMEVARRIGFPVYGVGMPSHFIAKHCSPAGDIYIDAFKRGRVLGEAGCAELLSEVTAGRVKLDPNHLLAVTKKQLLTRMLSNLLGIYATGNDYSRALAAIERILIINPESASYTRDYGLLLAAVGRRTDALDQLHKYLSLAPDASDLDTVREQIKSIRKSQAKWN
jgi:regulator of sirC expression with transglutaminase-like and TPR domain